MRSAVSYIRVSTEEQAKHGYSIEGQTQIIRDFAAGHALKICGEFVESHSAFKTGRPQFEAMLSFIKQRADVTVVLCYKIDRIARNLQDYSTLAEAMGVEIISVTEQLPSNPTGAMMQGLQAVMARFYSEQLSERVTLGLETKAKNGYWGTYAPLGYINDRQSRSIVPDPDRASMIRELFEQVAEKGFSVDRARIWARNRGLRSRRGGYVSRSAIHDVLVNPIYHGALPWKGEVFEGKHEPIISRELYDRVQERLKSRSHKKTKHEFAYRGLLTCGFCGCSITAEIKKKKYIYYRCTHGRGECEQKYHRQEDLANLLGTVLTCVQVSAATAKMVVNMIQAETGAHKRERKARLIQLKAERQRIEELQDAAYLDKLAGDVSDEQWLRAKQSLTQRLQLVEEQISRLEDESAVPVDEVQQTFELLKRAPTLYQRQSHGERAKLLHTVVSNCTLKNETIVPVYRKPFDAVAEGVRSGKWWR